MASLDSLSPETRDLLSDDTVEMDVTGMEGVEPDAEASDGSHFENLLGKVDPEVLAEIMEDLDAAVERDKESNAELDDYLDDGLKQLGLNQKEITRDDPFPGASALRAPILMKAALEFQAGVTADLFPLSGPATAIILGTQEGQAELMEKSRQRVERYVRWLAADGIAGYFAEYDKLFLALAFCGTVYMKTLWGATTPTVEMRLPWQVYMPSNAKDPASSPRWTDVLRYHQHEVEAQYEAGVWKKPAVELVRDESQVNGKSEAEVNKATGLRKPVDPDDERFVIYETHARLDLEGEGVKPYVVVFEPQSREVLAIYRDWREGDEFERPRGYLTDYHFIRWISGNRGLGIYHMIGGLARAGTGALRGLLDSAMVQNSPGGFILDGVTGASGGALAYRPFEYARIKMAPGARGMKLADAIHQFPHPGPSTVLFDLLGWVSDKAEGFGQIVTKGLMEQSEAAPVGTALAVLENESKVYISIFKRQHRSYAQDLRNLRECLHDGIDGVAEAEGSARGLMVANEDFDGAIELVPASDPRSVSIAQRLTRAQTKLQVLKGAKADGVECDLRKGYIGMLQAIGDPEAEETFPEPKQPQPPPPMDPASELAAILRGQPTKAAPGQDHQAHILHHQSRLADPLFKQAAGQNLVAVTAAVQANVADHLAQQILDETQAGMGGALPQPGQADPQTAARVAQMVAAGAQAMARQRQVTAQEDAMRDPTAVVAAAQVEQRREQATLDRELNLAKLSQEAELRREEMSMQERLAQIKADAQMNAGAQQASDIDNGALERERLAADNQRHLLDMQSKERLAQMNIEAEDRRHAMKLHAEARRADADREVQARNAESDRMLRAGQANADMEFRERSATAERDAASKRSDLEFQLKEKEATRRAAVKPPSRAA